MHTDIYCTVYFAPIQSIRSDQYRRCFLDLTVDERNVLQSSDETLARVLNYHVIPGSVTTRDMVGDNTLPTQGSSSTLNVYSSANGHAQVSNE